MFKRLKSIFFVIGVVMIFTAQTNRPDDKGQHSPASRQAAPAAHHDQARPQVQNRPQIQRKEAPRQVHAAPPRVETRVVQPAHQAQPARQERQAPRVYAVHTSAPATNNRLLHRQHHNNWRPRYNYYDDQYHFYPYVNIAATVDLSASCISVGLDGQTYFYDGGTFYQQDAQGQYVAVAPPIGIIVSAIPPEARQVNIDGQIYYRYKGVFYVQLAQGYQVVGPVQSDSGDS